jgi:hypothetical protein
MESLRHRVIVSPNHSVIGCAHAAPSAHARRVARTGWVHHRAAARRNHLGTGRTLLQILRAGRHRRARVTSQLPQAPHDP